MAASGIDTKASAVEKLKKGLDAVKKVATSGKTKGIASAIGAAVMSNKDTITKLAKSVGVPDNKIATVDQILKVANNFYAKDVSGGLIALAELTGHPLSEEEEQTIEREWRQARRSTTPVYSLFSKRKATAAPMLVNTPWARAPRTHALMASCDLGPLVAMRASRRAQALHGSTDAIAGMRPWASVIMAFTASSTSGSLMISSNWVRASSTVFLRFCTKAFTKAVGSVSNTVHANLRKIGVRLRAADTAESSFTDLVISRDGSSVRFGELDHVTIKGRVLVSEGPSVQFDQDIGEDLGVHLSTQDSAGVTVYTRRTTCTATEIKGRIDIGAQLHRSSRRRQFRSCHEHKQAGYTKIKPDRFGGLRNLHVKGSLIIDTFVCLDQSIVPPIGGWYFGDRQHEWYRPPNGVIVPEKQTEFGVARAGDLVISRGTSVLIRGDGSGFMTAGFVALFYLTVSYGGPVDVDSRGRCGNGAEVARKIVIVFQ
ncbi:hypothetical protein Q5P01_000792 [Channa striata]|uniref:Uncharacterized protein n=1 Tax=Channa striata TaxID=64152 RepID=A0AA88IHX9_CHASR|nr:hypothetical protein Q5P01_000792 [Channa striata]